MRQQAWHFEADADESLVLAAKRAGIRLPSSCRNGTCRACRCKLIEGRVAYVVDRPGLTPDEKDEGWILPCVAVACMALVIDAPQARELETPTPSGGVLTGARR